MGYHFKLDDFGTGYGGFAYLQSLGIRQIKIDKMFVDTIGTNDLKRSVLDAIIAFGRESGYGDDRRRGGNPTAGRLSEPARRLSDPGLRLRQAHAAKDVAALATGVAAATPRGQLAQILQDLTAKRLGKLFDIIRLMLAVPVTQPGHQPGKAPLLTATRIHQDHLAA